MQAERSRCSTKGSKRCGNNDPAPERRSCARSVGLLIADTLVIYGNSVFRHHQDVLPSEQMSNTITVRLPPELAEWLSSTAAKTGVPQGKIIRDQLEKARAMEERPFLRLAGKVAAVPDLSTRKGFSKK